MNPDTPVTVIAEKLASRGIVVSFAYGHRFHPPLARGEEAGWSVDVLTRKGQTFERPYAATSMQQAAEIALIECEKRGWLV